MPRKLTSTQIDYLQWIHAGNSIHFCTEVSNQLGQIVYSSPPTFKKNHRSIFNLLHSGYLSIKEEYSFGIRWAILFINQKGLRLLEGNNG